MNPSLTTKNKKQLISQAHHLKPVVSIGQKGLTPNVLNEVDIALNSHQLIKVKIAGGDKVERHEIAESIARETNAHLLKNIGFISIFYRKKQEKSEGK